MIRNDVASSNQKQFCVVAHQPERRVGRSNPEGKETLCEENLKMLRVVSTGGPILSPAVVKQRAGLVPDGGTPMVTEGAAEGVEVTDVLPYYVQEEKNRYTAAAQTAVDTRKRPWRPCTKLVNKRPTGVRGRENALTRRRKCWNGYRKN